MRHLLVLLLALAPLTACGPRTVFSLLFPTKYTTTTAVDFEDDGRTTRQTVVTHCKVVDQSDSIARNSDTTVTGERHWLRRDDGSLWVLGLLGACAWGPDGPPGDASAVAIYPDVGHSERPNARRLPDTLTYRFDDPVAPLRMDTYLTAELFRGKVDGLHLSAQIAPGGEQPTDSLSAAFPFLAEVEAARKGAETVRQGGDRRGRPYPLSPGRFTGVVAMAEQLRGAGCSTPDPTERGPVVLPAGAVCHLGGDCTPRTLPTTNCHERLGGLRPEFASDFSRVEFALHRRERAYDGGFLRAVVLRDAGAPSAWESSGDWLPEACIDARCFQMERTRPIRLYYPSRNILVRLYGSAHSASPALYLARPGPVWGGRE